MKSDYTIKSLRNKVSDNLKPRDITVFLLGVATCVFVITSLSVSGIIGNQFYDFKSSSHQHHDGLDSDSHEMFGYSLNQTGIGGIVSPEEAGLKTEKIINMRILEPSPNNVSAEFISASPAVEYGLPNFYLVEMNVTNPSGSQVSEVFTKKDASLVFLQYPRYLDEETFDSDQYH